MARYPGVRARKASNDPDNFGLVVNATPLEMHDTHPLPVDASRFEPETLVEEVVMKREPSEHHAGGRRLPTR